MFGEKRTGRVGKNWLPKGSVFLGDSPSSFVNLVMGVIAGDALGIYRNLMESGLIGRIG